MANIKDIKEKMPKKGDFFEKVRPEDELSEEELMEYKMLPSQKPERDMSPEAIKRRAEEFTAQQIKENPAIANIPEEPGLKDDDITEMFIPMGGTVKSGGKLAVEGAELGGKAISKAGIEAAEKAIAKMSPQEKDMFMKWWKYLTPAEKTAYKAEDAMARPVVKGLRTEKVIDSGVGEAARKMKVGEAKKALDIED